MPQEEELIKAQLAEIKNAVLHHADNRINLLHADILSLQSRMSAYTAAQASPHIPKNEYGLSPMDIAIGKALRDAAATQGYHGLAIFDSLYETLTPESDSGGPWTGENTAAEAWRNISEESVVAPLFRNIDMPTNPFNMPSPVRNITWNARTSGIAAAAESAYTDPAKLTLNAKTIYADIYVDYDLAEDSAIAVIPDISRSLIESAGETLDDFIVNTAPTVALNTSYNQGSPTFLANALSNGLRATALQLASRHTETAYDTITSATYSSLIAKLGKFTRNLSQLALIVTPAVLLDTILLSEVQTVDKFGPQATIITGSLAKIWSIPIVATPVLRLNHTNGTRSDDADNNTHNSIICLHTPSYRVGHRRRIAVDVLDAKDVQQFRINATMRPAIESTDPTSGDPIIHMFTQVSA